MISFINELITVLKSRVPVIVEVNGLAFELEDEIPGDVEEGGLISFTCQRVDVIE